MNKKGYTLIEVIVSIMILSIASITLAGAFINVIHFMSMSNEVKNASNSMYAYAEGDFNVSDVHYTIKSEKPFFIEGINVKGTHIEYSSDYSSDVTLKEYSTEELPLLMNNENYISLMDQLIYADSNLLKVINNLERAHKTDDINNAIGELLEKSNWAEIKFDNKLLPMKMSILRSSVEPLRIRIAYPWQNIGDYNMIKDNGPALIFITHEIDAEIKDYTEVYAVFYNNNWYCYNTKDQGSPYYLENKDGVNFLKLYKKVEIDKEIILTNTDFEEELYNSIGSDGKSIWKQLSPTALFDGINSNNIWTDISD